VDKLGEKVRVSLNRIFKESAFPAQATGIGSVFGIHTTAKTPIKDATCFADSDHEESKKLFSHMLDDGIIMLVPERLHGGISYAHTETDIENLTASVERFVKANSQVRALRSD
jgi:glutamate-1-semialdehyde aminotransferase